MDLVLPAFSNTSTAVKAQKACTFAVLLVRRENKPARAGALHTCSVIFCAERIDLNESLSTTATENTALSIEAKANCARAWRSKFVRAWRVHAYALPNAATVRGRMTASAGVKLPDVAAQTVLGADESKMLGHLPATVEVVNVQKKHVLPEHNW